MYADYSIECDDDYQGYQSLAIGALVLVVVSVGGTFVGMARFVRQVSPSTIQEASLSPNPTLWSQAFVFLSENYLEQFWYWRFVDFGRLVLLTSVIELVAPDTIVQLSAAIVFALAFLQLQSAYPSFKSVHSGATSQNDLLYKYALVSILLTLVLIDMAQSGFLHGKLHDLGYLSTVVDQSDLHGFTDATIIIAVLMPYMALLVQRVLPKAAKDATPPTPSAESEQTLFDVDTNASTWTSPPNAAGYLDLPNEGDEAGFGFGV